MRDDESDITLILTRNTMDIEYIKQHRLLTLEYGRGETYRTNMPTLYGHSTYERSSVRTGGLGRGT